MSLSIRRVGLAALACVAGLSVQSESHAALMAVSGSAPTVNGADIAQLVGGTDLGGNEGHVWSNRPVQGQSFTTLGNVDGYTLTSLTFGTHSGGFGSATSPSWTVRVGTVSGSTFTPVYSETATGATIATNQFGTWTLANAVALNPNTTYGIDVAPTGDGFVFGNSNNPNSYTGGTAYSTGTNATPDNANVIARNGDRVFHANLLTGTPDNSNGKISINFSGGRNDGNYNTHTVSATAGAIALANWNNIAGPTFANPDVFNQQLVDSNGNATTATINLNIGNTWDTGGPTGTDNDRMMRSYIDNGQGQTINISGLDEATTRNGYSVVVYYDTDSNGVFQIAATDNLGNTDAGFAYETAGTFTGTFIESLALTEAQAVALFNQGQTSNYLTLNGLEGGQFSLFLTNGNSNGDDRARISGIQIIANHIPEPTTAVMGMITLAGLGLRRRRVA